MRILLDPQGRIVLVDGDVAYEDCAADCCGVCTALYRADPCPPNACNAPHVYVCTDFVCTSGSGDVLLFGVCYSVDRSTEYAPDELEPGAVVLAQRSFECLDECGPPCPEGVWFKGEPCPQCFPSGPSPWLACADYYRLLDAFGGSFSMKVAGECWSWSAAATVATTEPTNVVAVGSVFEHCCDCCDEGDCAPENVVTPFSYRYEPWDAFPGWQIKVAEQIECCCAGLVEGSGQMQATRSRTVYRGDGGGRCVILEFSVSASGGTLVPNTNGKIMQATATGTATARFADNCDLIASGPVEGVATWRCNGVCTITAELPGFGSVGDDDGWSFSPGSLPPPPPSPENPQFIRFSGGYSRTCNSVSWFSRREDGAPGFEDLIVASFSASWGVIGDAPCDEGQTLRAPPGSGSTTLPKVFGRGCAGCGEDDPLVAMQAEFERQQRFGR